MNAPGKPLSTITLAEVPVHAVNMCEALGIVDSFVSSRRPHYNVAINAAKVVEFQRDEALRQAIREAHLLTADGQSIVWAARLLGHVLPGRIAGADMMELLLSHSEARGYSVYFLGAREDVVRACVDKARRSFPKLRIAGFRNGYFSAEDEMSVAQAVRDAAPDILFLGFGTPAKEYFMNRHYLELGVPFMMGVGGTFDVFAGLVRRAPRLMQRAGLEWFFRMAQEPRRMWKRYLIGNSRFIALVLREVMSRR